jgi:hypothetical protein
MGKTAKMVFIRFSAKTVIPAYLLTSIHNCCKKKIFKSNKNMGFKSKL